MSIREIDLLQVRRTGEHFKKILREVFANIPRSAQSIAGLTRWTGINKSTCQRLVQALTKSSDGIDFIILLPGPDGLNKLKVKFESLIKNNECLTHYAQLVKEYEDLIFNYSTSQTELKRLLLQSQERGTAIKDAYTRKLRKTAYEANREIIGESVDMYLNIHLIRANKADPSYIDEFAIFNRTGIEHSSSARPFVLTVYGNQKEMRFVKPKAINHSNITHSDNQKNGLYILEDFSTPGVEKTFAGIGKLLDNVIYNHTLLPIDGQKYDMTSLLRDHKTQLSPVTSESKILIQGVMQRSPAKRVVLLTIISKELDKVSTINSGCYPTSMNAHITEHKPEDLWSERFSDSHEVKLFKPEEKGLSAKTAIPHLDAMLKQLFEIADEDQSNYVGYYVDIAHPLWLTNHRFYFDFS